MTRISWEVGLGAGVGGRLADPEPLWDCLRRFSATVVGAGASVDISLLARSTEVLSHPYLNMRNGVEIVESVRAREREGYAAAMIAPAIDPALLEARATVAMPVVGSLEAAFATTQFVGRRVGVIAVDPGYAAAITDAIARYGVAGRVIERRPVRTMPLSYPDIGAALHGDAGPLAESIAGAARGLIDDGADVVIGACQFYGAALWAGGVGQWLPDGVAFVDCAAAGLVMARAMADLRAGLALQRSDRPGSAFHGIDATLLDQALSRCEPAAAAH